MIYTEYLIVGQGIAGTLLALELLELGKSVIIIDDEHANSSSKVAAGIINPITGRNYVKSWMIDALIDEAKMRYNSIATDFDISCVYELPILRSLHTPKEENLWSERMNDPLYVRYIGNGKLSYDKVLKTIHAPLSFGEIKNSLQIDLNVIIEAFRASMIGQNKLLSTKFSFAALQVSSSIIYEDIKAEKIIFCEGYKVVENPFFNYLPFDPVKGEVLIIEIEDGFDINLRDKQFITPLGNHRYWCGSGYKWKFENADPTLDGGEEIKKHIGAILKVPYRLVDHKAGIRPATKTRKPLMGRHPQYKNVYIFNGLGTKGSSLGPYFAKQFSQFLTTNSTILDDVDIGNFNK